MECKAIQDVFNSGAEIHSQSLYRLAIIELTVGSMNRNLVSSLFYLSPSSSSYITNYLIAILPTLLSSSISSSTPYSSSLSISSPACFLNT